MTAARPRAPRERRGRKLLVALAVAVSFVAGVGVGAALREGGNVDGMQTGVRTLNPLPLVPAARETVTVTVTTP